jgi:hypothetical protein
MWRKLMGDLILALLATSRSRTFCYRLQSKNVNIKIYKIIILPFVLYGCETWSLTLREEHRLRIFGSRRDEVMEG